MDLFSSPSPSSDEPARAGSSVVVATDQPLPLRVDRINDDRAPDGMVVLGSFLGDRLVARCAVPEEAALMLEARDFFQAPARLVLAARVAPPGLQCQLFALIELPEDHDEDPEEPWAASVPGAGFERAVGYDAPEEDAGAGGQAAVLLGQIVRFDRDRKHLDNLPLEAIDVLSTIVQGRLVEVVDKVLDDLLG